MTSYYEGLMSSLCRLTCFMSIVSFWTVGPGQKCPMNWGLSVLPSFPPSLLLSGSFLGIGSLVFSETQHDVRGPCVVRDRVAFFEKNIFSQKMGKMGQKTGFFEFIGNFIH